MNPIAQSASATNSATVMSTFTEHAGIGDVRVSFHRHHCVPKKGRRELINRRRQNVGTLHTRRKILVRRSGDTAVQDDTGEYMPSFSGGEQCAKMLRTSSEPHSKDNRNIATRSTGADRALAKKSPI